MKVVKMLEELVQIETVNPPGERYLEFISVAKDFFSDLAFQTQIVNIPQDFMDRNYIYSPLHKGNERAIAVMRNGSEPKLHFNFHYDVVPPGDGWVTDPFKLKVIDDRAYGRGTSDMKGALVSLYGALSNFNDLPIEIALVPDEESGGIGTRYLTEEFRARPERVIMGEPSFPNVYVGHFGIIRGMVKVFGKQVHASKAREGRNAFLEASRFALEIWKRYSNRRIELNPSFEGEPTVNLGGYVVGSTSDGVVPGSFGFSFYRSVSPINDQGPEFDRKILEDIARELGIEYEFEVKSYVPGSMTNTNSETLRRLESCVKLKINWEPRKVVTNIRYDGVFYRGADVVNFGPGEPDQAHVPNESVSLRNVEKVAEVYECVMRETRS
nr:M20 family metallopeptidase [Metallosphaera hakonensis]